jgi:hypothetical protein
VTHPLAGLKALFRARAERVTGTVVSVEGDRVVVATARGRLTAAAGGQALAAGMRVVINNGVVEGRLRDGAGPVYRV